MNLKNKETGELVTAIIATVFNPDRLVVVIKRDNKPIKTYYYKTIAEFTDNWVDVI